MKALFRSKYGGPDVLKLVELDLPQLEDSEVLIRNKAVSINSWDWDLLTGKPRIYRLLFGVFKPKNQVIGADISGVVVDVGNKVTKFKVGDEVFGDLCQRMGGFAEYVPAREDEISLKLASMTFQQAAALPQAGVLALQSLFDFKALKAGDEVLINGAAGGMGTFAVQIAKAFGAKVTGVDRRDKLEMLRKLGADHTIDYQCEKYTENGKKYDLIIDAVAHRFPFSYAKSLKKGGAFVMVGGKVSSLFLMLIIGSLYSILSNKQMKILVHKPNKGLEKLKEYFEAGWYEPVIQQVFSFSRLPEALDRYGKGDFQGKMVVNCDFRKDDTTKNFT